MSYLKTLLSKDVIVTPFKAYKKQTPNLTVSLPVYSPDRPYTFNGENIPYPLGGGEEGTGSLSLVYNSIKHLFYSNYLSGSEKNVSPVSNPIVNPDGTLTGNFYTPNYENNIQSIDDNRLLFPTESGAEIKVVSVPGHLIGEGIRPGSYSDSLGRFDDGQGNVFVAQSSPLPPIFLGNIFYEAGIVTNYTATGLALPFLNSEFESTVTIYETQYKCTIRANEYNYSLNPSLLTTYGEDAILTSGNATYQDFVTGSDFSPYVTTVGLYDDDQNLIAVAKLAQPLPTSQTTDTTILINIDR